MKIQVNGQWVEVSEGISGTALAEQLGSAEKVGVLALELNGAAVDLYHTLQEGDRVRFLYFEDAKGREIFWHTSAHLLAQAVLRLFPGAQPTIGPSIEQGFYYDFANLSISDGDLEKIEQEMRKIVDRDYLCKRYRFQTREEALSRFASNPYKVELIQELGDKEITAYEQGEFFDLCRGPHLSRIGKIKACKVLKTSGAYWRGDSHREMLTRIYGISYPDSAQLKEYLRVREEAQKRDHKVIGPKLDLFSLREEAPGIPFIHPRGMVIWNQLIQFLHTLLLREGYVEIKTPHLLGRDLWQRSGHWSYYRENMYAFEVEDRWFAIKPMSCPGCMLYYSSKNHSYRELPLRIAEIGLVHRHEASGALSGLFRVRSFHQDDAHIFMKPSDITREIFNILELVEEIYTTFGLSYRLELSTRPEHSIGTDTDWEIATNGLRDALEAWGRPFSINEGDGAFYGPKIDLHIQDAIGRSWQCGTIQLDMSLPEKFALEYTDVDGSSKRPVMVHRAILGSVERFFGILIEHFGGKFPLWLNPLPIRVIPIADRHIPYARTVALACREAGFICQVDETADSVRKKIRNAQVLQVNYMLSVGDQEVEHQTVSLRTRKNVVHGEVVLSHFLEKIGKERSHRLWAGEYDSHHSL